MLLYIFNSQLVDYFIKSSILFFHFDDLSFVRFRESVLTLLTTYH
ncbi:hypothetical protein JCM19294_2318 [Nonlabens tegetincola]|uniref:Uncharacterized protein n=1 Tax=Nonlabens tegetincola TaxID=323273 RepID=A0A090QJ53_9FLAO|nr:hypothetical protein JCM19294_2318 [Nonlabens tegetincola]